MLDANDGVAIHVVRDRIALKGLDELIRSVSNDSSRTYGIPKNNSGHRKICDRLYERRYFATHHLRKHQVAEFDMVVL
jgi:hypothetical protein